MDHFHIGEEENLNELEEENTTLEGKISHPMENEDSLEDGRPIVDNGSTMAGMDGRRKEAPTRHQTSTRMVLSSAASVLFQAALTHSQHDNGQARVDWEDMDGEGSVSYYSSTQPARTVDFATTVDEREWDYRQSPTRRVLSAADVQ